MKTNNFTESVNRFYDSIGCQKTYMRKSDWTSGNEYYITLSYKGKRASFHYHDNFNNRSEKIDFLYSLLLEAQCYEEANDALEFARNLGYESHEKAYKAYNACMRQSRRLHKLFSDEEINILSMIVFK